MIRKLVEQIITQIYPMTCVFCGKIHKAGICSECQAQLPYIEEPRCKQCGKPLRYQEQEYCVDCKNTSFSYDQGRSLWIHKRPVNHSVYQFKYHNKRIFAKIYVRELYNNYETLIKRWGVQSIIPVPLYNKKQRRRGYNQAALLADYLGAESGIEVEKNVVFRHKNTKPQKELNDKERKKNLHNAFIVSEFWKVKKSVLLMDDIYTTGSTIDAIATLLKEKGVQKVYFLTISIGQGF